MADPNVRQFFGTDGVRGPYGGPLINERFAFRLGAAAGRWLVARGMTAGVVLSGRDTRASGAALEQALAHGLTTAGAQPRSLGVLPTPAVSRAVQVGNAALGVVITASHNPASDNGIKFFGPAGLKLTDEDELHIEHLIRDEDIPSSDHVVPIAAQSATMAYIQALTGLLPAHALDGWAIVLDTAHGSTSETSPAVLRALGARVVGLGDLPDGKNINAGVGSEHPEQLAAHVLAAKARLGIAHDGDGDRCVLCDETGAVLDGDEILTILALHALALGQLVANTLVVTVQSNLGVDAAIATAGGRVVRTAVGDRYVIERMLSERATLGGESSGHIICSDVSPTGDGLVAALKVIEVMLVTGRPLSELRRSLKKFPQLSVALVVREKKSLEKLSTLAATVRALETELGTRGRVLVRWSGTEPKLRLLVEGETESKVSVNLARLKAAAAADLEILN